MARVGTSWYCPLGRILYDIILRDGDPDFLFAGLESTVCDVPEGAALFITLE